MKGLAIFLHLSFLFNKKKSAKNKEARCLAEREEAGNDTGRCKYILYYVIFQSHANNKSPFRPPFILHLKKIHHVDYFQ